MEKVTDAQVIEQALARVLLGLDSSIYGIKKHELADVVKIVLFENEVELGSWKISPGAGLFRRSSVQESYTALKRGLDVSIAKSGTLDDMPEDEAERHEVFLSISRKFKDQYDLLTGQGNWAAVREMIKGKAKTGQRRYPNNRIIEVVNRWENLDRDDRAITLSDFLEEEFGQEGGVPKVAKSTFYEWRRKHLGKNDP